MWRQKYCDLETGEGSLKMVYYYHYRRHNYELTQVECDRLTAVASSRHHWERVYSLFTTPSSLNSHWAGCAENAKCCSRNFRTFAFYTHFRTSFRFFDFRSLYMTTFAFSHFRILYVPCTVLVVLLRHQA